MKLWAKIKSIGWVTTAGAAITAVLFAMAGIRAGRHKRRAKAAEDRAEELAHDRTKEGINKAAKYQEQAQRAKEAAVAADKLAEERLAKLGESDESIDAIADRFNSKRLRS